MISQEEQKRLSGYKAVEFLSDGMVVGLGTGSTAKHAVDAIGEKGLKVVGVPTSDATREQAMGYGIEVKEEHEVDHIDVTIDGADQIDEKSGLCIKGGGGAHYLEKKVAKKTDRQIIIVDESKVVENLGGYDVPLEIDELKRDEVMSEIASNGWTMIYRDNKSDSGNLIGDVIFDGSQTLEDFEADLMQIEGVIDTGVFNGLVNTLVIARSDGSVEVIDY